MQIEKTLGIQNFFPDGLEVGMVTQDSDSVHIKIFTHSTKCKCPKCGTESAHRHGTYVRKLQDLPIFGKKTILTVNAYEYQCDNPACETATFAETMEGFLNYYSRMTSRCAAFVRALALETSCEGCARICREMGLKVSGDTAARILKRELARKIPEPAEECIGVDDFSTKKGKKYCTIVCNAGTHTPIAVLEGRDGESLKEWLQNNRHVKTVTRDRASAYAKAISEVLPDAMQVADRFHLHQNLLDAVKKALASGIPQVVTVTPGGAGEKTGPATEAGEALGEEPCKKNRDGCG